MSSLSPSTARRLLASVAVALSLAATSAVAPSPAGAVEERAPRAASVTVTIKVTPGKAALTGQVRSSKRTCRVNRKVVLYYQARTMGGWMKIRAPKSNSRGTWRQAPPRGSKDIPQGRYYAQVAAKRGCKADKSPTIAVR